MPERSQVDGMGMRLHGAADVLIGTARYVWAGHNYVLDFLGLGLVERTVEEIAGRARLRLTSEGESVYAEADSIRHSEKGK